MSGAGKIETKLPSFGDFTTIRNKRERLGGNLKTDGEITITARRVVTLRAEQ
ncbi:HU family DNA-binding protein [Acidihalobacter yilgarnensis]|uniref:HU family DNA-binding protein n=1 Tax=Acidihalobacter yilgarnensis TaxID=2819280 RepID=UPI0012EAB023